ncbi:MAG: hypothetical protein JWO19_1993 [Bryobacterales bacterium]|nr:hypothetical protein [Bryobacterales bacterium]
MVTKLVCLGVLTLAALAQDIPNGIKYDLTGLTYPRIGRLARVQGVVTLKLTPSETESEIELISGNVLLVREPTDNLAKWRTNQPVTVNYIFKLTDPETAIVRVPKGDAFDRLILRMFHLATYTEEKQCLQLSGSDLSQVTEPRVVQQSPLTMEVRVAAPTSCLITVSGLLASR